MWLCGWVVNPEKRRFSTVLFLPGKRRTKSSTKQQMTKRAILHGTSKWVGRKEEALQVRQMMKRKK